MYDIMFIGEKKNDLRNKKTHPLKKSHTYSSLC